MVIKSNLGEIFIDAGEQAVGLARLTELRSHETA